MYAVIETGGKQYKVQKGDEIFVEKLAAEDGKEVEFKFREDGKQQYQLIAENDDNQKYFETLGYKPIYEKTKTRSSVNVDEQDPNAREEQSVKIPGIQ